MKEQSPDHRPQEKVNKSSEKISEREKTELKEKHFLSEKDSNIELINNINIKLGEWTVERRIGGEYESPDGGIRNDEKIFRVRHAGFILEIGNNVYSVRGEDINKAIKKISDDLDIVFSEDEILELKEKFPKFTVVNNPFIVEEKKGRGRLGYYLDYDDEKFNEDVKKKLLGLRVGESILKNENYEKDINGPGNLFTSSEIVKIISREDAQRRRVPGNPYSGSVLAVFPEKMEEFNEIKSIKEEKVPDEIYECRTFKAEVLLESVKDNPVSTGYRDVCYKIKNVPTKIREYEITENLDSGNIKDEYIGEREILEDKYIFTTIRSDQLPIENGEYTIKYIVPTSGKHRGRGSYHIITPEELKETERSYKKEENDPYQIELAKTAVKMDNLVSSHNTQNNLLMYAVKKEDGLWYPYVGKPLHLYPLKGFKSKMSAKSSEELIKMYKDANYNIINNNE